MQQTVSTGVLHRQEFRKGLALLRSFKINIPLGFVRADLLKDFLDFLVEATFCRELSLQTSGSSNAPTAWCFANQVRERGSR